MQQQPAAGCIIDTSLPPKNLELYGNVDIRQVNLAFLWPERIKSILVEEGDFVKAGQPVAEQETDILKIEIEQAKAAEQAAYQTYLALKTAVGRKTSPKLKLLF